MEPDAVLERARLARDHRFDGRFFVGVLTTGIYCRPICPARTPRSENVRFFATAAAAGEAGFRPCLRCRPECAPGSSAWTGTSVTVRRGLRLIAHGALDEGDVESLADRLGVTSRHLRRLFTRHLGASPLAVAHTQRLHFAKRLIDDTRLPMADIAAAAGFGSVRRFNDAFRHAYGRSPRELRRTNDVSNGHDASAALSINLPYRQPLHWEAILDFFRHRAIPGVESVGSRDYRRTIAIGEERGVLELQPGRREGMLQLTLHGLSTETFFDAVQRTRELFDLDAPVDEVRRALAADPALASRVAAMPGVRVTGAWNGFELAIRAVLGQQISVAAATTLAGRIAARYGEPLGETGAAGHAGHADHGLRVLFPTPQKLARARFNDMGLVGSRIATIRAVARAVECGDICFDPGQDTDDFLRRFTAIKGIGAWTAHYVAMRALKYPDAFPASDLGLLKALDPGKRLTPKALSERAELWRPWRAYAASLLWNATPDAGG